MKNHRDKTSYKTLFTQKKSAQQAFLLAPDDQGIARNFGRVGAKYGPSALVNLYGKLQKHLSNESLATINVWPDDGSFEEAQLKQAQNIAAWIDKPFIHIGGGHDHIYSLLRAIDHSQKYDEIIILNLDPHLDTRKDKIHHSGTPFRNFDQSCSTKFELYQYGIHKLHNCPETMSKLQSNNMRIIDINTCREISDNFQRVDLSFLKINPNAFYVLSLDCDVIENFKSVSAPVHFGLPIDHIRQVVVSFAQQFKNSCFGIYEYNPKYDDYACSDGRKIAYLMHLWLKNCR